MNNKGHLVGQLTTDAYDHDYQNGFWQNQSWAECDEFIWIFEYIGRKHLHEHFFISIFVNKYIRTFVRDWKKKLNIWIFELFRAQISICSFVWVKFFIRIYSGINSYDFFTNIFKYWFLLKFLWMSHSDHEVQNEGFEQSL